MKIEESSSVETNDFRVMIYPSSRKFTAKESMDISQRLYDFLSGWKYHGKPVSSSFKIEKNQFIVICIDEEEVSPGGCALDSLSDFLKELDREYGFELLNRMKVSYVEQGVSLGLPPPAEKELGTDLCLMKTDVEPSMPYYYREKFFNIK